MFTAFNVSHFRRFEALQLDSLSRVNLFTGPNGAGKTSLLEALFIWSGAFMPELALRVNVFRGMETMQLPRQRPSGTVFRSLFYDMDPGRPVVLEGVDLDGTVVRVEVRVPAAAATGSSMVGASPTAADADSGADVDALELTTVVGGAPPVVSMLKVVDDGIRSEGQRPARVAAVFLGGRTESSAHEMATRLGKVVVAKRLDRVVHALQVLEPELRSLASVVEGDKTVVYADIGRDELVPLWLLGGGINHLAHIVLAILEEDGRVVLIDEIENGVHYSALPDVWRVIDRAAVAAGAQVFATTHSRECVAAAHQVFSETLDYGLSVRRLEPHNGRIDAVAYDRESLEASLDAGFEVR